jgi:lipoprotein-anchoring transpeptidase ErfK/SrfK
MKLFNGLVLSVLMLGFPFLTTQAQTVMSGPVEDEEYTTESSDDNSSDYQDPRLESNSYTYNDESDASDDEDSSSDNRNLYFDSGFKKLAYNTPEYRGATSRSTFIFDPNRHRWYAYDRSGELVGSGRASGGRGYCPDIHRRCKTPIGTFHVYSMGGPGCVSTKFPVGKGGAPMPWCMYFHGGYAVHGSYELPNYNASHGCIRIEPAAAHWLQQNVIEYGTTVIVKPY